MGHLREAVDDYEDSVVNSAIKGARREISNEVERDIFLRPVQ